MSATRRAVAKACVSSFLGLALSVINALAEVGKAGAFALLTEI
jgi:hypothetical protein